MRALRDVWVMRGSSMAAEGDAYEITRLLDEMDQVSAAGGGWRQLYRRAQDSTLWELSYPESEMHGGGPRLLRQLDIIKVEDWV